MNKLVAIVGMAGAGKSEVARMFEREGFERVRFGDITDEELKKRGLELTEENERFVREELRREHGMAAYAKLNLARIDALLGLSDVVIDGLYSWEEYVLLKKYYGDSLYVVAVWSSPKTRYRRLSLRSVRPLTEGMAAERDIAELENTNKGGPIAMADFTIINESTLKDLAEEVEKVVRILR